MTRKTLTILAMLALLGALALPGAQALPPQFSEDNDRIVLENDHVRVWFQGKKPMLKIIPANATDDENATNAYGYKFVDLVEYNDLDGDGLPSNEETLASLNLHKATGWNVTSAQQDSNVTLTLSLTAPVKLGKGVELPTDNVTGNVADNLTLPGGLANISIVFHIYDGAETIATPEGNITIPATSIKYDLIVNEWPFVNAETNRLAIEIDITGDLEVDGGDACEPASSSSAAACGQNATVRSNDTDIGELSWVTTATGHDTDGAAIDIDVRAATDEGDDEGTTRLAFTYDAPNVANLLHDPTVGTTATEEALEPSESAGEREGANAVPATGILLLAATVGGAALLARRR